MPDLSETAPAQPVVVETPAPQTAVDAAVVSGDQAAFKQAKQAERSGNPLPDVAPAAPALAPELKPVSKRQQAINDYERRIAEQDQRIRALEAASRAPAAPRSDDPAPAPAPATPEWKRYASQPDAPKLADFETVEEHTAAMSYFIAKSMLAEQASTTEQRAKADAQDEDLRARAKTFTERVQAGVAAMPGVPQRTAYASDEAHAEAMQAFAEATFPIAALNATPLRSCVRDARGALIDPANNQPVTFANFAAQVAFESEQPTVLLAHLHAHLDETRAIASLSSPAEVLAALMRLDGRLSAGRTSTASAPPPKTLTDAPAPPVTLGSRPAEPSDPELAAVRSGDQAAYKAAKRRERAAALGR